VIEGDPAMTIAERPRRDFTVNAILQDPLTGEIIDRSAAGLTFKAECLRAVSVATFARTVCACCGRRNSPRALNSELSRHVALCRAIDLTDLPAERIWGELEKLLLRARQPSIGFGWLHALGCSINCFPRSKH